MKTNDHGTSNEGIKISNGFGFGCDCHRYQREKKNAMKIQFKRKSEAKRIVNQ